MQVLERDLGCRLFNRSTRRMQLTEPGRVFYERCLEVQEAVERAEASVSDVGGTRRGVLRVTAPLGLGRRVVAPLIPIYRSLRPGVDVRLRLSDHVLDLFIEAVDIALRMAVLPDSSLVARRIADLPRVLVASPAYLERHGAPRRIAELGTHQCLLLRFSGSAQFRWTLTDDGRPVVVTPSGPMDTDDGDVLVDWALAGEGIVLKPEFEVASQLRQGSLVRVLPDNPPLPVTLALVYPHRRLLAANVKDFSDLVFERARIYIDEQMARAE